MWVFFTFQEMRFPSRSGIVRSLRRSTAPSLPNPLTPAPIPSISNEFQLTQAKKERTPRTPTNALWAWAFSKGINKYLCENDRSIHLLADNYNTNVQSIAKLSLPPSQINFHN